MKGYTLIARLKSIENLMWFLGVPLDPETYSMIYSRDEVSGLLRRFSLIMLFNALGCAFLVFSVFQRRQYSEMIAGFLFLILSSTYLRDGYHLLKVRNYL